MTDMRACPMDKLLSTKDFPHADCVRRELHRVWVIRDKLKPGASNCTRCGRQVVTNPSRKPPSPPDAMAGAGVR